MRNNRDMHSPSQVPDFHPEFGYLCPSARVRAGIRLAAIFFILGLLFGGTMVRFALADRPRDAAVATDDRGAGVATIAELEPLPAIAAGADASPARSRTDCNDVMSSFLNPGCRLEKQRKRHAERINHRVATYVMGRDDAAMADASVESASTVQIASQDAAPQDAAPIPLPVPRPTATPPKPRVAQARGTQPSHPANAAGTYAQAEIPHAGGAPGNPFASLFGGGLFGVR